MRVKNTRDGLGDGQFNIADDGLVGDGEDFQYGF